MEMDSILELDQPMGNGEQMCMDCRMERIVEHIVERSLERSLVRMEHTLERILEFLGIRMGYRQLMGMVVEHRLEQRRLVRLLELELAEHKPGQELELGQLELGMVGQRKHMLAGRLGLGLELGLELELGLDMGLERVG